MYQKTLFFIKIYLIDELIALKGYL